MKFSTLLHLVQRLRMRGGTSLFSIYTFMEWTGTGLHLPFIYLLMMSILQVPRCVVLLFNPKHTNVENMVSS
jgi:hypothetical protein